MALLSKTKTLLALDIGSNLVKAIQIKSAKQGWTLENIGFAEVPATVSQAKGDAAATGLGSVIRTAIMNSGSRVKDVVTSISGEAVIVRYISFPEMSDTELANAIRWQIEEHIPYRLDDINLDYHKLGVSQKEGTKKIDVLLVAARKDLVNERINLLKSIGLNPAVVDVDAFAVFNAFEANYEFKPDEVVALVNIGAQSTNIIICQNQVSLFARDISLAGNSITQQLASKMGISFADAEKLKVEEGTILPAIGESAKEEITDVKVAIRDTVEKITGEKLSGDERARKISDTIRVPLQNLVTEIRRTLQFFENQQYGKPVNRIVLSGGTAKLENIDSFVHDRLGLPTEIFNALAKINTTKVAMGSNELNALSPSLVVGVGLALR
ncbi:MAG: type IV pilus assembly protein PilM [bacterium]|nr:type IV pilus assembly protein PilM [bacterium]